jgi:hypothetical protein
VAPRIPLLQASAKEASPKQIGGLQIGHQASSIHQPQPARARSWMASKIWRRFTSGSRPRRAGRSRTDRICYHPSGQLGSAVGQRRSGVRDVLSATSGSCESNITPIRPVRLSQTGTPAGGQVHPLFSTSHLIRTRILGELDHPEPHSWHLYILVNESQYCGLKTTPQPNGQNWIYSRNRSQSSPKFSDRRHSGVTP